MTLKLFKKYHIKMYHDYRYIFIIYYNNKHNNSENPQLQNNNILFFKFYVNYNVNKLKQTYPDI